MTELIPYNENQVALKLKVEHERILFYAEKGVVDSEAARTKATEDLALIALSTKVLEDLRLTYTAPRNDELKAINAFFRTISDPLAKANTITRDKVKSYLKAQMEAAKDGDEALATRSRGMVGLVSTLMVPRFKIIDAAKVPAEFWIVDEKSLDKQIKAGRRDISGIEIWEEPALTVRQ